MNKALNRSSTPGTEPLCIIRFIAESGYSALQINCDGFADGCRRSRRRGWIQFARSSTAGISTDLLQCARLVAQGSDAGDYRDFMSGSILAGLRGNASRRLQAKDPACKRGAIACAAIQTADNKASGLCRIGLLLSIARRGQNPSALSELLLSAWSQDNSMGTTRAASLRPPRA